MYKVIWLVKFQPDKPREEVLEWWRGRHAELAKVTPGMLRYVQSYWVEALDPVTQQAAGMLALPMQCQSPQMSIILFKSAPL